MVATPDPIVARLIVEHAVRQDRPGIHGSSVVAGADRSSRE